MTIKSSKSLGKIEKKNNRRWGGHKGCGILHNGREASRKESWGGIWSCLLARVLSGGRERPWCA